jgi:FlgD Ig-like domain
MEGPACYKPAICDTTGDHLRAPLYSYAHNEGTAVIGGYRYWGTRLPELSGLYIFGDYTSGVVWGLHYDGAGTPERFTIANHSLILQTVGLGFGGEILFGASDGKLYRLGRAPTGVAHTPSTIARLLGNFPNPFNPSTTIRYRLDRTADIRMDIVAADGTHVRRLESGVRNAGTHDVPWRGETDAGGHAASGVYFCRLVADHTTIGAIRLVLVQ